jgi:nitrite reductase/ring-hydroxylating ferredoxin subunit
MWGEAMENENASLCGSCCASRREFLKTAGYFAFAMTALPVSTASGIAASGNEIRYPIPAVDGASVDYKTQVILVRYQNAVYAFALSCPHQNNAVKWMRKDGRFQCTKHDSRYRPDGVHTSGRATRNMDRYVIRREGDVVVVDLQHWFQSDQDPSGWASAAIHL